MSLMSSFRQARFRRPHPAVAAAVASLLLGLSACAASPTPAGTATSADAPGAHVHGLSVNAETGQVLLATHDGLFDLSSKPVAKIGPTNDLMGFTAAADAGTFYASGHPGQGSSLPNPVGLIKSTDGGKTWEQLSRQGESDFHTLTTTKSGIVAFDGTLRTTTDGKTWTSSSATFAPAVLAGNPSSNTVLATTVDGIQRSTDGGRTWKPVKSSPVIQFAAFADAKEAVGVEPDGSVHYSADGGATWAPKGKISAEVQAVAAAEGTNGNPKIWVATTAGLLVSTDGGMTFRPADAD